MRKTIVHKKAVLKMFSSSLCRLLTPTIPNIWASNSHKQVLTILSRSEDHYSLKMLLDLNQQQVTLIEASDKD